MSVARIVALAQASVRGEAVGYHPVAGGYLSPPGSPRSVATHMTGEVMSRRATDAGEPTNRELLNRITRIEQQLDKVIVEHTATHSLIDSSIAELQRGAILREERMTVIAKAMPEIAELHDFRIQVETLSKTAQLVFGGSLLAAIAAISSLILSLSHLL